MKAFLLAGYRESQNPAFPFALRPYEGQTLLDWQIQQLKRSRFEVCVILAREESEVIIRTSRLVHDCELIFDTSDKDANLVSNARAGMAITTDQAIILPVDQICPPPESLSLLVKASARAGLRTSTHFFTLADLNNLPDPALFPLLITRCGNDFLKKTTDLNNFGDTRFVYNQASTSPEDGSTYAGAYSHGKQAI